MSPAAEETIARLKEQAEEEAVTDEPALEEDETPEEEAPKKHGDGSREYVILQTWTEAGRVVAATSKAAIESLPEGAVKNGAKYVAVPVRNWNEHEIVVETKTLVTIK